MTISNGIQMGYISRLLFYYRYITELSSCVYWFMKHHMKNEWQMVAEQKRNHIRVHAPL